MFPLIETLVKPMACAPSHLELPVTVIPSVQQSAIHLRNGETSKKRVRMGAEPGWFCRRMKNVSTIPTRGVFDCIPHPPPPPPPRMYPCMHHHRCSSLKSCSAGWGSHHRRRRHSSHVPVRRVLHPTKARSKPLKSGTIARPPPLRPYHKNPPLPSSAV